MCSPVLVKEQENLLGSAERKHGQKHAPATLDDAPDEVGEPGLFFEAALVALDAVRRLANHDVWALVPRRHARGHEVPVFLGRVVARVEHARAVNVEQEHAGAQDVSRGERRHAHGCGRVLGRGQDELLLKVERDDLAPRALELVLREQLVVRARHALDTAQSTLSCYRRLDVSMRRT